jgi:cytosine/adenosine deaminase-related metal-dependent hydrolase
MSRPARLLFNALSVVFAAACGHNADARLLAITDVAVVDVDAGVVRRGQTLLVAGDTIAAVGPASAIAVPTRAQRLDGRGRFVIPGLWDMHTHAHRDGRARWHYPAYLAHGVTGIRDAGTFADSAAAWRARLRTDTLAPTVWWGSPPLDGVPAVLSFAVSIASPDEARAAARRFHSQGYDFLKVYDRLDPASYRALAAEARALGLALEGHVPLRLSPGEVAIAGQRTIEHLTLVLESCIPGTLAWVAADTSRDAMGLLADGRLAASLARYHAPTCGALFDTLAKAAVWQVPTLVQLRGAFLAPGDAVTADPRLRVVPMSVREAWVSTGNDWSASERRAGWAVYRRQLALVGELHRAGVPLLAGTDASDEPWVIPGASLHDELALFVEAGLSPLEALRTATSAPARYRGETGPLLAPGRRADLVLLANDPTENIGALRHIEAVVLRGRLVGEHVRNDRP